MLQQEIKFVDWFGIERIGTVKRIKKNTLGVLVDGVLFNVKIVKKL